MKEKLLKQQNRQSRDYDRELMELTAKALEGEGDEEGLVLSKSSSGVEVYTRGACSNIKNAFEVAIAEKKRGEAPVPFKRRQSVKAKGSSNLPNMFQQKEKREAEYKKQRGGIEGKHSHGQEDIHKLP